MTADAKSLSEFTTQIDKIIKNISDGTPKKASEIRKLEAFKKARGKLIAHFKNKDLKSDCDVLSNRDHAIEILKDCFGNNLDIYTAVEEPEFIKTFSSINDKFPSKADSAFFKENIKGGLSTELNLELHKSLRKIHQEHPNYLRNKHMKGLLELAGFKKSTDTGDKQLTNSDQKIYPAVPKGEKHDSETVNINNRTEALVQHHNEQKDLLTDQKKIYKGHIEARNTIAGGFIANSILAPFFMKDIGSASTKQKAAIRATWHLVMASSTSALTQGLSLVLSAFLGSVSEITRWASAAGLGVLHYKNHEYISTYTGHKPSKRLFSAFATFCSAYRGSASIENILFASKEYGFRAAATLVVSHGVVAPILGWLTMKPVHQYLDSVSAYEASRSKSAQSDASFNAALLSLAAHRSEDKKSKDDLQQSPQATQKKDLKQKTTPSQTT